MEEKGLVRVIFGGFLCLHTYLPEPLRTGCAGPAAERRADSVDRDDGVCSGDLWVVAKLQADESKPKTWGLKSAPI